MTEQSATPQGKAIDTRQLEELATGFRLLGDDSPLKRFYFKLAKTDAEHTPTAIDMAVAATAFSKKLEGLALPENPNDISTGTLEIFTESLSNAEIKALQYAAGRDDTMTRRSALSGLGLMFGAAMTAGGATAWAFQNNKVSPPQTSSNAAAPNTTKKSAPESTMLFTFGGALITLASLMQNLRKRKENASAFEAERRLPKTAADILVGTDKQLRQAMAASKARESGDSAEMSRDTPQHPYTFTDDPAFIAAFQKVRGQLSHDDPLEIFFQKWGESQGKKPDDAEGIAQASALFFDTYLPDLRSDRTYMTRAQHLKKLRGTTSEAEHPVSEKSIERFGKWMQPKHAEILYVAGGFHTHKNTSFKRIYNLIEHPELPRSRDDATMIDLYVGYVGEMLKEMEGMIQKTQKKMTAGQQADTWAGAVKPANYESGINR